MKLIILLLLLVQLPLHAQDMRFIYRYKFVADTLNKDSISEELVVLDINIKKKLSFFTGLKHIISDSTMNANFKRGIHTFPYKSMKIRYVIEKQSKPQNIYFYTPNHTAESVYKVKEERNITWNILNEKDKILGYTVQNAKTFFAGREWSAWFTSELPINDGPYKFHGLPGLILKITDKTKTHSFEIVSVQKQNSTYLILGDDTYKDAKLITLKEYEKLPTNPYERFKRKALMGDVYFKDEEQKQNFLKDIEIKIKESKLHDNNPIELNDYYKK